MTTDPDDIEPERDYWQEYKDDRAMGYINEDGSYREPEIEPPDDGPYSPWATDEDEPLMVGEYVEEAPF